MKRYALALFNASYGEIHSRNTRVAAHANRMTFLTFNCDGMVLINDFISSALLSAVDELVLARFSTENGNVSLCTYRGAQHLYCI